MNNDIKKLTFLYLKGVLGFLTGRPCSIYVLNKKDNSYGVLSDCGTYTKISQLPIPYEKDYGYVFTQDDKG